ncbi:MAG: cellulose biosynthesis cyclic di-GMP-binding regulatory protein BcsB [Syntrophaceae bacterium]|nr:cellulose biosynthesis cyclic di-GMP-binding regulatory protein BcsB [Syntrophaceae bacterium]
MEKYISTQAHPKKNGRGGINVLAFLLGSFLVLAGGLFSSSQAQELIKLKLPLTRVAPVQTTKLHGTLGSYWVKVPIPARWQIEKATLHFSYVNSTALIPRNSRLTVLLNNRPLAQVTLQPTSPVGDVAVSLPPRLLKPGYQEVEFNVVQHYTLDCEEPTAPELWTVLELDKSYLEFEFRLKAVPLQLRAIADFLFDPRLTGESRVNLVIEDLSAEKIELAGLIASGLAVRFDYRPVVFSVSQTLQPKMDNVLVGEAKFVKSFLGERSPEIKGAFLSLMHLPLMEGATVLRTGSDPGHALIVVSGEKIDQVREAARTLAAISFSYPGTPSMEVKEIRFPAVEESQGKNLLTPGEKYSFQALGLETTTFRGMWGSRSIELRIPTPFVAQANEFVWVTLHMAYGSGMRKDSVLNIYFNEKYVSSIFLENPQGGIFRNYQVPVPAYQLRRGRNVLTFSPVLTPLITGWCEYIQTENLLLTIFGDSTLKLPPMTGWVDLPRMELFFQDGFPFTRWPDGRETTVFLAEKSLDTVSAALNLVAILSQKIGYPATGIRFSFEPPKEANQEVLAVGPISRVPPDLLKGAPIQIGKDGSISYPQLKKPGPESAGEDSWVRRLLGRFVSPPVSETRTTLPWAAFSAQASGLGAERAILTQFQSPRQMGRSVLLLSANTSREVLRGALMLWEPVVQGRIGGDVSILELPSPDFQVASGELGSKYYVGDKRAVSRLTAALHTYPWLFLLLLILAFIILAYAFYRLLKKQRKRRIGHEGS